MQAPNRKGSSDPEKEELERRAESLERQLARALAENERLRKQLEEALRANKRSAAPFSKGNPKTNRQSPERKRVRHTGSGPHGRFPAGWMSKSPYPSPRAAPIVTARWS